MGEIAELIERLEKATGPDRVLDGMIFRAVDERPGDRWEQFGVGDDGADVWYRECREEKGAYISPSFFTASIDAALTLVPKDLAWRVDVMTGLPGAIVCVPNAWVSHKTAPTHWAGTTPAIALCIAALKARASVKAGERSGADGGHNGRT